MVQEHNLGAATVRLFTDITFMYNRRLFLHRRGSTTYALQVFPVSAG